MDQSKQDIATVDAPQDARPNLKLLLAGLVLLLGSTAGLALAFYADSSDGSLDDESGVINATTLEVLDSPAND